MIRAGTRLATALFTAALCLAPLRAAAQTQVLDIPIPGIGPPPFTGEVEMSGKRAFWKAGRERWFFAATGELGNFYLRTTGAAGYGRPHWSWGGVEGSSAISPNGGVLYGGLHFARSWLDVRAGARYTFTSQHYLSPRETYTKDQTEITSGPKLRYAMLEAEAASGFPAPRGAVFGIFGVYHPLVTQEAYYMVDPAFQMVTAPGLSWRARVGYTARVDRWDMFRIGGAVELLGNTPRGLVVVRVGPSVTALLTHHLEAYGAALLVVHSRDTLGLSAGQLGELGFRYRWATGDRWPEVP